MGNIQITTKPRVDPNSPNQGTTIHNKSTATSGELGFVRRPRAT